LREGRQPCRGGLRFRFPGEAAARLADATPAEVQRQRVKAGARSVEFDAGHHPFLSRPGAFADSIAAEIHRNR
jgi:pimeloyl-ACP methyl ester carboxylesterase